MEESPPLLRGAIAIVRPGATLDPRVDRDEEFVVLGSVLWVMGAP